MLAIGVDTHAETLAVCAVDALGRALAEGSFANGADGHRALLAWLGGLPQPRRIGLEGAANLGAALARALAAAGEEVHEVPATLTLRERRHGRRPGKSDPADALAIARVVAREEDLPLASGKESQRHLKLLVDYREELLVEQTRLRNRLYADLAILAPGRSTAIGPLDSDARVEKTRRLLRSRCDPRAEIALRRVMRLRSLRRELKEVTQRIEAAVAISHSTLTAIAGVGPVTAARLLGEIGDPQRFRSAAAFAMGCGVAPIPASSGKTQRHRLNRGGNRKLNHALHTVALVQARDYAPARAYLERKRSEGKSWREAMRCLKRHLADVVYRRMLADATAENGLTT